MIGFGFGNVGFVAALSPIVTSIAAPMAGYASPYPTANLFQYNDVNQGAAGVVLNSSGQVTQWTNKVSGGAHFVPKTAGPLYLNNIDGFPALNLANSDLSVALNAAHSQPFTATVLVKIVVNPSANNYQVVLNAGDMNLLSKFTTGTLIQSVGVNNTGPDITPNLWVPITVVWDSSGHSFAQADRGAVMDLSSIRNSSFSSININQTDLYMRLMLCYDRAFAVTEVADLHTKIRAAYNLS